MVQRSGHLPVSVTGPDAAQECTEKSYTSLAEEHLPTRLQELVCLHPSVSAQQTKDAPSPLMGCLRGTFIYRRLMAHGCLPFPCCSEGKVSQLPLQTFPVTANHVSQKDGLQCTGKVPLHQLERRTTSKDLPSMSRRCMIIASSTSLGMYPRERIAMPSSCLDIKPFPSLSSTRKASRISVKEKEEERSCYGGGVSTQCIRTRGTQKQHVLPCLTLMVSIWSFRVGVIMSRSYTQIFFVCAATHGHIYADR